jgi:hypothetical protein
MRSAMISRRPYDGTLEDERRSIQGEIVAPQQRLLLGFRSWLSGTGKNSRAWGSCESETAGTRQVDSHASMRRRPGGSEPFI